MLIIEIIKKTNKKSEKTNNKILISKMIIY